ncbi:hypothetical protein RJ639_014773 [Escallonia herrerae]|uniref:TOG domain-containing protein n=1 Tax=Escallonia herrerae TaxID=1293975 RepID=A0AA89AMW5_9ASTE|nr:hypothetical protein RJ639_014773 [Escallonia herrerae]
MMRHALMKARGTSRVNNQQVVFDLKHRVVLALNKLADRDTYQIGVEQLEKIIQFLTPDGVAPFLSCILDTDSEQKSAVRKECIRLMGTVATFHEGLIGQYLGKMVASIVKRLKDPDSVVRDACVETVGVLATKLSTDEGESDGVFVVLVKPLFEALGEQNKQVQSGSALCLARVIDNTNDPPLVILQRMLTRTVKLLKNPHFMAKPAVIELNRSIIQAGGAPTRSTLSAALASIQDALKNSDWQTRKAASTALGEIASSGGSYFSSFKSSCIHSLESCRFDKVKPARDTVLQALHLWKSLPGPDTPEPSEAGSSIKGMELVYIVSSRYILALEEGAKGNRKPGLRESFCGGDYGDITSVSESTSKDVKYSNRSGSVKKRIPLMVTKAGQCCAENVHRTKGNDWQIEVAVPKTHNVSSMDVHPEESEGSCVTRACERASDIVSNQYLGYEYVPMDDKQEYSCVSNLVTSSFDTNLVAVSRDAPVKGGLVTTMGSNQQFEDGEMSIGDSRYLVKMQDRRSLDSAVTDSCSQTIPGCCLQTANEMATIRKQLLEIENKQIDLLDMLKSKVSGLEQVVDRIAEHLVRGGRNSDLLTAKVFKKSSSVASPRLSTCTPRPSVDIRNRQPLLPMKSADVWEEKAFARSKLNSSSKQVVDTWTEPIVKTSRNPTCNGTQKNFGQGTRVYQTKKGDSVFGLATTRARHDSSEVKNSPWKLVTGYLSEGDLESAYLEALHCGEDLVLVELIDKTGPVLESLSHKTANDVLSTLASYFFEQRSSFLMFPQSSVPELKEGDLFVVDLSTTHGPNYLLISSKSRREFLSAIKEAVNMEFVNTMERRSAAQLVMKLQQMWGKAFIWKYCRYVVVSKSISF